MRRPKRWRARLGTHCRPPEPVVAEAVVEVQVAAGVAGPVENAVTGVDEQVVIPPPEAPPAGRRARRTAAEIQMVLNSHNIAEYDGWLTCVDCQVRHRPRQRSKFQWCLESVDLPGPA